MLYKTVPITRNLDVTPPPPDASGSSRALCALRVGAAGVGAPEALDREEVEALVEVLAEVLG